PGNLGYPGVPSWSAPQDFEDIVGDCYIFAVLQRLQALRKQLRIKPNVDGLISRNVENFLIERRRRFDPIGYSVFGNVRAAALEAAAAKAISLENLKGGKVYNESVLRLDSSRPDAVPAASDLIHCAVSTATGLPEVVRHLT